MTVAPLQMSEQYLKYIKLFKNYVNCSKDMVYYITIYIHYYLGH